MRYLLFMLLPALALAQEAPPMGSGHALLALPLSQLQTYVSGIYEEQGLLATALGAPPVICVDPMTNRRELARLARDGIARAARKRTAAARPDYRVPGAARNSAMPGRAVEEHRIDKVNGNRAYAAARVLLAAIFLLSGAGKLLDMLGTADDIAVLGLPFPVFGAIAAGVVEPVCGVLLVLGLKSCWAAAGLLLFMVPVTLLFEHPSRGEGALIDFLKNGAIIGGLLMVVRQGKPAMRQDWDGLRGR